MKKMILVAMTGLLAVSCVNNKVVKYNEDYTKQYISLEKEAEQWQKDRLQQSAQN